MFIFPFICFLATSVKSLVWPKHCTEGGGERRKQRAKAKQKNPPRNLQDADGTYRMKASQAKQLIWNLER